MALQGYAGAGKRLKQTAYTVPEAKASGTLVFMERVFIYTHPPPFNEILPCGKMGRLTPSWCWAETNTNRIYSPRGESFGDFGFYGKGIYLFPPATLLKYLRPRAKTGSPRETSILREKPHGLTPMLLIASYASPASLPAKKPKRSDVFSRRGGAMERARRHIPWIWLRAEQNPRRRGRWEGIDNYLSRVLAPPTEHGLPRQFANCLAMTHR